MGTISIKEYCEFHNVSEEFILALEENGTMFFSRISSVVMIDEDQLENLEKFRVWKYELGINEEGIDVIYRLLERQKNLLETIESLRREVRFLR